MYLKGKWDIKSEWRNVQNETCWWWSSEACWERVREQSKQSETPTSPKSSATPAQRARGVMRLNRLVLRTHFLLSPPPSLALHAASALCLGPGESRALAATVPPTADTCSGSRGLNRKALANGNRASHFNALRVHHQKLQQQKSFNNKPKQQPWTSPDRFHRDVHKTLGKVAMTSQSSPPTPPPKLNPSFTMTPKKHSCNALTHFLFFFFYNLHEYEP